MANTDLQTFLERLYKNLNRLKEREAKYAGAAPIDLLNQIDDYSDAIVETENALNADSPPSVTELEEKFESLILGLNVVLVATEPERLLFTGDDDHPPYRGLQKFTEDDHHYFFGRTAAVIDLLQMVDDLVEAPTSAEEPDLVAVLGTSGSGKSSLVRAGLIPVLRAGETITGSNQWPIAVMQPGPRPLESLAQSLVSQLPQRGLPTIQDDLHRGPAVLHQLMLEALANRPDEAIFMLVVDQFEELFTQTETEAERQAFLDMLLHAAQLRGNRSFIIVTMRADFYAQVGQYKALAEVITKHQLLVAPMDERELREAILRPAEAVGLELDKGLEERLVRDTLDQPGSLPLLQHALLELYNRREEEGQAGKRHARLPTAAYELIGGVQGALARRADAVLNSLTLEQRELARDIFLRLTSLGEGAADTRRRVPRSELYPGEVAPIEVDAVLAALTDPKSRLVVTDQDSVEVTHEALIQRWGTMQHWLSDNRESLQIHRHLTEAAAAWERLERDPGELYRGARLAQATEWQNQQQPRLTPLEADFLQASIDAVEAEAAQRRRNRQRVIGAVAAVMAMIIALLGIGFWLQGQNAREQARLTEDARVQAKIAEENALVAATAQADAEAETARAEQEKQRAEDNQAEAERQTQAALTAQAEAEESEAELLQAFFSRVQNFAMEEATASGTDPGEVVPLDASWKSLLEKDNRIFAMSREYGDGRVIAIGHSGVLIAVKVDPGIDQEVALTELDQGNRFLKKGLAWLNGDSDDRVVLISTGHCEWAPNANHNLPDLVSLLDWWGFTLEPVAPPLDGAKLEKGTVLIVGNGWGTLTQQEIDSVEQFVAKGGGLFVAGLGWSWEVYGNNPAFNRCLENADGSPANLATYPMNLLVAPYGMEWSGNKIEEVRALYRPAIPTAQPALPPAKPLPPASRP